jgi:hypothetical protein
MISALLRTWSVISGIFSLTNENQGDLIYSLCNVFAMQWRDSGEADLTR